MILYKGILMKISKIALLFLLLISSITTAFAKENKWYRVEMLIFEMKDKQPLIENAEQGKPSFTNAINLNSDPSTEFSLLLDNQLALQDAKRRIQKNYHLVLHKGWRQMITDKEHAQKVHLIGGKQLSAALGEFEVDGTVRLSSGRNLNIDADLLFRQPSSHEQSQAFRLKESSRLRINEISYIDHPMYGVIVMVTPEKVDAPIAQKTQEPAAEKVYAPTDDKPIFPADRKAMVEKGAKS